MLLLIEKGLLMLLPAQVISYSLMLIVDLNHAYTMPKSHAPIT